MFKKLFLTAVLTVAVGLVLGCGGDSEDKGNPANTNGNNNGGNSIGGGNYDYALSCGNHPCKTVAMPDGKMWMAENLNYKTGDSWCYGNADSNCVKYGRLYTWGSAKTACPTGWRLPDTTDWRRLVEVAGGEETAGNKLKSKSGWYNNGNGTDNFGFSALPGGFRDTKGNNFGAMGYSAGKLGNWWASTGDGIGGGHFRYIFCDSTYVYGSEQYGGYGYSVRCIKN
jgi:uncharacterized protein (TIGR02145 family)